MMKNGAIRAASAFVALQPSDKRRMVMGRRQAFVNKDLVSEAPSTSRSLAAAIEEIRISRTSGHRPGTHSGVEGSSAIAAKPFVRRATIT